MRSKITIHQVNLHTPGLLRQEWVQMRNALWPQGLEAMEAALADLQRLGVNYVGFVAKTKEGELAGFAESSLRPYVNGCETAPVAFLEGIYIHPPYRQQGLARWLIEEVEAWAKTCGCTELGSDALTDNLSSHAMHEALGFTETERVIYFRKPLV